MSNEREPLSADEVDLFEIIGRLWRQKFVIGLTASLGVFCSTLYVALVTPVYEAKLFIHSPTQNDIAQLNYGRGGGSDLGLLGVKDVYDVFQKNLQSESARYDYFHSVFLPSVNMEPGKVSTSDLYRDFNKSLTISLAPKGSLIRYEIAVQDPDADQAVRRASDFIDLVAARAKDELLRNVQSDVVIKAENLEQQIAAAQEVARNQRADQIIRLEEALAVARSIGLEAPLRTFRTLSGEGLVALDGSHAYMRGINALEAEIQNLQGRPSDDPFTINLRQQQAGLKLYRELKIDPAAVAVYRQDGGIEQPQKPINPKSAIIVGLGGMMGLMLGMCIALIRDFGCRGGLSARSRLA
ncbi:LPS O-antigen chain length determinant protein WzzB [Pseudomonas sp. CDFA 553]|uniref:Wzz/FepE/Etk N-terminal domain-containing protein n=1 Tax=Pseudomonas quasicaspiana TaxID=2829821 RepID=UPI001E447196|nr:Wzz/FepE/Etk N-terminal domain-containing protein [Pseudomonas quasicaspiana]MCD5987006.1 LPS O-antigen chain length determinant protein WzzB [Pseudomonas quasicaspiana]